MSPPLREVTILGSRSTHLKSTGEGKAPWQVHGDIIAVSGRAALHFGRGRQHYTKPPLVTWMRQPRWQAQMGVAETRRTDSECHMTPSSYMWAAGQRA